LGLSQRFLGELLGGCLLVHCQEADLLRRHPNRESAGSVFDIYR
jgi:hypothetical protein